MSPNTAPSACLGAHRRWGIFLFTVGEGHGWPAHKVLDPEPWRVCIRDASGSVLGAGMLLCTGQVMTCAHVIVPESASAHGRAPDVRVAVEVCGYPEAPQTWGRGAAGGW